MRLILEFASGRPECSMDCFTQPSVYVQRHFAPSMPDTCMSMRDRLTTAVNCNCRNCDFQLELVTGHPIAVFIRSQS